MKIRTITSTVYVLAVIALCAGKWLIPDGYGALLFDAVFCLIGGIGAFELIRALGGVSVLQRAIAITFSALAAPLFALMALLTGSGWLGAVDALALGAVLLCVMFVADHNRSDLTSTLRSLFALVYVGLLTALLSAVNHMTNNSMLAIMVLFICTPFTDAAAFLTGMALGRRLPAKLAPAVSPNKTIVGAIGGLIGGIAGGVAAYYLFVVLGGQPVFNTALPGWAAAIIIGFAVSIATQFGDLFESAIKRAAGVKDMGKLLPGHGGVLDRFDGTLFAGIVVFIAFAFIA